MNLLKGMNDMTTLDDIIADLRAQSADAYDDQIIFKSADLNGLADAIEEAMKGQTNLCLQACNCEYLAQSEIENKRLSDEIERLNNQLKFMRMKYAEI